MKPITITEFLGPKSSVTVSANVPEPVVPPPATYTVTLVLNQREAEAIMQLCMQVGGTREGSARGITAAIHKALSMLGVDANEHSVENRRDSVYFTDYVAYTKS